MGIGVVIDTSYLITLADPSRAHHETARRYWRHFMENQWPVFLPTIVVSEFCIRQQIPVEVLRCCVVLPFNWDDAQKAADLDFARFKDEAAPRDALKDDIKIIAQTVVSEAGYLITDDGRTMGRVAQALKADGKVQFSAIVMGETFDRAILENGQGCFGAILDETKADGEE